MGSSIQDKTVRPGSLMNYNYYHASTGAATAKPAQGVKVNKHRHFKRWFVFVLIIAASAFALTYNSNSSKTINTLATNKSASTKSPIKPSTSPAATKASAATAAADNPCIGNTYPKLVLVSISQQHLWACQNTTEMYSSPVVTGIAAHVDTITPTGTFDIYAKVANTTLTGCDSTGCWKDPVHFWMPFLDNQYGAYGLHDATWRPTAEFGNVNPASANGSQGCVELPLATSTWLYGWVEVGTPVTIKN
jgi:lipoprotein-anchoring transpeptidase ErfK/SrfK